MPSTFLIEASNQTILVCLS